MKIKAISVGLLATAIAVAPISSAAAWPHFFHHGHGGGPIVGLFGLGAAVVVGAATIATAPIAIIANAASGPDYDRRAYGPPPGYYGPAPYSGYQGYAPRPYYGPPQGYAPAPGYYGPAQGYYGPPQAYYGRPQYAAPQANYSQQQRYAAPQGYGAQQGYAPPQGYNQPPPGYGPSPGG
jgi:hypothetical protein